MYVRKPEKCTLQKFHMKVKRNHSSVHPVCADFVTVGYSSFAKYMLHCVRDHEFFGSSMTSVFQDFFWYSILLAKDLV